LPGRLMNAVAELERFQGALKVVVEDVFRQPRQ
jgi:hypothetical protein